MPKDYYTNYLRNLAAVSAADVQDMAKKYIRPEAANIVVVGSADEVAKKLEQFGKVELYDNYGRPTTGTVKSAAPSGITAEAVRQKYITALGGTAAFNALKSVKLVYAFEPQPGVSVTITEMKSGGKMKREVSAMGQTMMKQIYADGKGSQEAQGQSAAMEGAELAYAQRQSDLQSALHMEKYGVKYSLTGMEKLDGADVYVLETTDADGSKGKEYYGTETGLLVKSIRSIKRPQGDVTQTNEYGDYRDVPGAAGYRVPYALKLSLGPQMVDAKLQTVEINKPIADGEFK